MKMNRMEYFARNYLRDNEATWGEMDEWWEEDPRVRRAFIAGAKRMAEELEAMGVHSAYVAQSFLDEAIDPDEMIFVVEPDESLGLSEPDCYVQIRGGAPEKLAKVPFPKGAQRTLDSLAAKHEHPQYLMIACRMLQEIHWETPDFVIGLAPLFAEEVLLGLNVSQFLEISLQEVIDFSDQAIADGRVSMTRKLEPAIREDAEELALKYRSGEYDEIDDEEYDPLDNFIADLLDDDDDCFDGEPCFSYDSNEAQVAERRPVDAQQMWLFEEMAPRNRSDRRLVDQLDSADEDRGHAISGDAEDFDPDLPF
jgi:hypothetical protein